MNTTTIINIVIIISTSANTDCVSFF